MSSVLFVSGYVLGPVAGALAAIGLRHTRGWQIMTGAVAGAMITDLLLRLWNDHAVAKTLAEGGVVIVAAGDDWRFRLIAYVVLITFALLVGSLVAVIRRWTVRPE